MWPLCRRRAQISLSWDNKTIGEPHLYALALHQAVLLVANLSKHRGGSVHEGAVEARVADAHQHAVHPQPEAQQHVPRAGHYAYLHDDIVPTPPAFASYVLAGSRSCRRDAICKAFNPAVGGGPPLDPLFISDHQTYALRYHMCDQPGKLVAFVRAFGVTAR